MKNARVGSRSLATLIAAFGLALCAASSRATVTWTNTAGSWDVAVNWSPNQVPADGDDVVIGAGANVLLASSSSNLASLALGGTLTFSNWNTTLSATNVSIASGGMMTLPGPFINNAMSNNVYIVCTNLFVDAGASIDATAKGYATGANAAPGNGPGGGAPYCGGGYGGVGASYIGATVPPYVATTYGSITAPVDPGSGGGNESGFTGPGGGAILIRAPAGTVTVNGTIAANGGNNTTAYGGGGSGGSIYIMSRLLAGTNGAILAKGGNGGDYTGGGGGGRVAVYYDVSVQQASPKPSIQFSVQKGGGGSPRTDSTFGTIYLPDSSLLTDTIAENFNGRVYGPTSWRGNTLTISNTWVQFASDGFQLIATNDLVFLGSSSRLGLGGSEYVNTNGLVYNWSTAVTGPSLSIGGKLSVTNGAKLEIFAGITNGPADYGALVSVTGDVLIGNASWIYPYSQGTNGGSVLLRMGSLTVAAGGGIDADGKGFLAGGGPGRTIKGYGPGGGSAYSGGSYGGRGVKYVTYQSGDLYGSPDAPLDPGSGGGGYSPGIGGNGGGLVRIETPGHVLVNGLITAGGMSDMIGVGAGSGGGVYLQCGTFAGTNGAIQANGAYSGYGAGGGGRIAMICTNTAEQQLLPKPRVLVSVSRGAHPSLPTETGPDDMGTLYFPSDLLLDETWLPHTGKLYMASASWSPGTLTISNGWIRFAEEGFQLSVAGDVRISGPSGILELGGNQFASYAYSYLHTNAPVYTGTNGPVMRVGGDLVLSGGGVLGVYAGMTNAGTNYGALVNVTGATHVAAGSWIYAYSHPTNGGSALFELAGLTIDAGGGIDASRRGFRGGEGSTRVAGYGPGPGGIASAGSHGGLGGVDLPDGGYTGPTYGSSNAPVDAGSGGGGSTGYIGGFGGGSVRIRSGDMVVNGSILANGEKSAGPGSYGAGAGGSIYIQCKRFAGATGVVQADGGDYAYCGGGGGRIAIWRYADDSAGAIVPTALGGAGGYRSGAAGTVVWKMLRGPGAIITVR